MTCFYEDGNKTVAPLKKFGDCLPDPQGICDSCFPYFYGSEFDFRLLVGWKCNIMQIIERNNPYCKCLGSLFRC
jgi:hypothetical protein